ncbi:MAG: O-antigen ligase family protein [Rubrivivax sp.]|nr:O-antigen ligase family protein [Rubrivivax sp.]
MPNPSELLFFAIWVGIALVLAALAVLGLGAALQLDRLIGRRVALSVVPIMGLGISLGTMLSGRDLRLAFSNIEAIGAGGAQGGTSALRLLTLCLLATCAATVLSRVFEARARPPGAAGQGRLLMGGFMAYYLCNAWLNALFGSVPAFTHQTLYVPVAVAAVFVWRDQPLAPFLRTAKWTLAALMAASLLLAVAKPDLALQPGYKGWIPGSTVRLWGVGSNPNSIGPLALLLLLLEFAAPSARRPRRALVFGLGLTVLLLAQSKTAWGAALFAGLLLGWYRWGRAPGGGMRLGFALGLIALLAAATLAMMLGNPARLWERLAGGQVGSDVQTLTGRLQIWAVALEAWRENPLFGYGPSAWGPAHRMAIGLPFAFSAHNQFLQSLSAAGTLGLASLLFYLAVLARGCWRAAAATRGFSLALLGMVLLRCATEAPVSAATLFNGDVLTQIVLLRVALAGFAAVARVAAPSRRQMASPQAAPVRSS